MRYYITGTVYNKGNEPRPVAFTYEAKDWIEAFDRLSLYSNMAESFNARFELTSLAMKKSRGVEYEEL